MYILKLIIFIGILDTERFCESVAEVMAGTGLQCLSVMHQRLNRIGSLRTCKLLLLGLASADDRHCQYLLAEVRVQIQHLNRALLGFLCGRMRGVSLLPQELPGTEERSRLLLPAYHRTPLVVYLREVTVGVNNIFIKIAEQCLRCRSDAETLRQRVQSAVGYPCNLRCKSLHVILFFFEQTLRNKKRHVYILHAGLFESAVKLFLDILPDRIACRTDDHTSLYRGIIDQLRLFYHVRVPLCEINIHRCDRFY